MSVLEPLIAAAERRLRADARIVPMRELRDQVRRMPPAPRFGAALRYGDRLGIIAEVKRASPSEGAFASVGDGVAAAVRLATGYADAGARAISVLTEPTRFGGSDDDLERTARRVTVPALRKDFITTPYGVWQARALGAGAVLLIVRALTDDRLRALLDAAGEAGIDALVEVHDAHDLERAVAAGALLIGVNARDLDTLHVDVPRAMGLLSQAATTGATLVAESGLSTAADLDAAARAGAHAVLVGTSLLRTADPIEALRALVEAAPPIDPPARPEPAPARTAVKVCGLRTEGAVRAALVADADLAGFIIAPDSRRAVAPQLAGELARGLMGRVRPVLVTRAPREAQLRDAIEASGIATVQLAGFEEPPAWTGDVPAEVIGVVHAPRDAREALVASEAWLRAGAGRVMLEAASAATGGGDGTTAAHDIARDVGRYVPAGIAGGLRPENVAALVREARPAFVDAASGLERDGETDPARLARFVREARRDPTAADRVDRSGRFGRFGGRYVPETLMPALAELEAAWNAARRDAAYREEAEQLARDFIGRPTPVFEVPPGALRSGGGIGPRLFLKREDLAHTGAHKINNALGQALLAKRMGKPRVIAETGAGQHGVATATACALLGMQCVVYMGSTDIERQAPNVRRMRLLGAEVRPVTTGNGTLRDALNEALRDWVANVETTFYVLGSAAGPHPYPDMVASLQSVVGREARAQILAQAGRLPDAVLACVGGGSNAIGIFRPFLDAGSRLIGVEAGGRGDALGDNAASLGLGSPGVLHGALTMLTQTEEGQVVEPHSVSAGLDYPGVGPQLAALAASGRLEVMRSTDAEALDSVQWLSLRAGIVPALEPAHALAAARRLLPDLAPDAIVLVNLSGRGDKDLDIIARELPSAMAEIAR